MEDLALGLFNGPVSEKDAIEKFTEDAMKIAELSEKAERRLKRALELVDMEEQGRLVVLPCKEGTEVYKINYRLNGNHEITKTWFSLTYIKPNDFGKTVFLTREEAEQALAADKNDGCKIGGAN